VTETETGSPAGVDPGAVHDVVDSITRSADASAAAPRAGRSGRYDFSHPDLLTREQSRSLRTVHEGYAQALAKRLSTELLSNVSARVLNVEHLTYAEFLARLPSPALLAVVEVPELAGKVALDLDLALAFAFVDRLLGGPGDTIETKRALTAIEQGLMDRVLRKGCQELDALWRPIQELHFKLSSIEANPELARVVSPEEMVVLIAFEITMNERSGRMNLCLPYVVIEPAIHRLGQGTTLVRASEDAGALRTALGESVAAARLEVDVSLGTVQLTLRELLQVEPGDVLRVAPAGEAGAVASVEGEPRLCGVPGRSRGHRALRVTEARSGRRGEGGS
jgi:flagellar motor switch protein FliM